MVAVCGEVSEGQNATGSLGPPPSFPPSPLLLYLLYSSSSLSHTQNTREEEGDPLDCFI